MQRLIRGKEKEWAKTVAKTWIDPEFKAKLMADPKTVLKEHGTDVPARMKLNIAQSTEDEVSIALPAKPSNISGSVEEIQEPVQADSVMITSGCN